MIADALPGSLVSIYYSPVEEIVAAGKYVQGAEYLEAQLVSVLDEPAEHVIVPWPCDPLPFAHIRSYGTVIKNLAHNGFHIHHDIAESEVPAFLEVEQYGVRSRQSRIVGLAVEPHVIMVNSLIIRLTANQQERCRNQDF